MREMHEKVMRQQRFAIGEAEESLIEREVEDALHATAEDRMAAGLALEDAVYGLWLDRGLSHDAGLCRFPGCAQQRRRGLRRDRRHGRDVSPPIPDHA